MSTPARPPCNPTRLNRLIQNPKDKMALYQLWQSSQNQQDVKNVQKLWNYQNLKPEPNYLTQNYKPLNEFTFFNGVLSPDPEAKINTPNPIPYNILAQRTGNYQAGAWFR